MRAPAVVRLPVALLKVLFPDSERVVKIEAETVEDVMNGLGGRAGRACGTVFAIRRQRFDATSTCSLKANARVSTPGSNRALTFSF